MSELTPEQEEISEIIFEISDDGWSASWYPDIEFIVWEMLTSPLPTKAMGTRFDHRQKDKDNLQNWLQRLHFLYEKVNGWITRIPGHGEESFVPMNEWLVRYESWKQRRSSTAL